MATLRPKAVTVEPLPAGEATPPPNTADAIVEQVVYHGFVSHLYLRLPNDAPLISYQQNQGQASHPTLAAGMRVRARWDKTGNHVVRD
jgi:putative spermidine/putrescine transport system ATP-binding protein